MENEKNQKPYNIGLDIGTTSVGWAVVEQETNKILKRGNHPLWGVRLFEEATTAETRRMARSTRRRYDRRRKRIKLLRQIFEEEIIKVDSDFFKKLNEFAYHENDNINKTIKLTKEEKEGIKKYYNKYPTIYHLRNAVMEGKETDIRLVYLAIHHIIKYRGNFLYNLENFDLNSLNIIEKLESIFTNWNNLNTALELGEIDSIDYFGLEKAIFTSSKTERKLFIEQKLKDFLPRQSLNEFLKLVVGNKFSIAKLFGFESDDNKLTISFKDSDYDDKYSEIEKVAGNMLDVLSEMKELYDMIFLKKLFRGREQTNLSSLMIERYETHKEDLKFLKTLLKPREEDSETVKEIKQKEYSKMFKNKFKQREKNKKDDFCIYEKYVHNHLSYEEFKKELEKTFGVIISVEDNFKITEEYKQRIENGDFLPRITDTDNGKYPYQLNKTELIKIIENQPYEFLKEKMFKENRKKIYKLVQLLEFRIPYYVGPLNNTTKQKGVNNKNAWLVKKESQQNILEITPFNFDDVIDKDKTAEEFITRMISHCTYLFKEEAMPADSILYSESKVRNELKQIKVDGYRLPLDLQEKNYKGLFLKVGKTIDEKTFKRYLMQLGEFSMYLNPEITGYSADRKFANNMKSYVDFFGEDGIFLNTPYTIENAEEIIRWITIFEDKEILKRKLVANYPELSKEQLDKALARKYKGWSRLSKKLLTEIIVEEKTSGTFKSIMDLMRETEDNFMQIISRKEYGFEEKIEKENKVVSVDEISYELVKDLVTSPATKRGIYQALLIVKEITDYLGYPPVSIMLEMARGEEKKIRKDSRKDYLLKLYQECKKDIENYKVLFNQLNGLEPKQLDNEKFFLYFIQEGKSLYSGCPLNIEDLDSYEVDHIIPRTLIKDDSIDNKALVLREENQKKAASFVVPKEYRDKCHVWWEKLYKNKLISAKKRYNLMRAFYKEEDIEGFINRQLVETRQITKHVANILKAYYKDTKVISLHANVSHNYREKENLFKFRELNDYHHAHDAYLAAVLGNYKENYLKNADFETLKERTKELYEQKRYKEINYGYLVNSMEVNSFHNETGEVFNPDAFKKIVEDTLYRNDILVTKKTEIKTGEFYIQTKNKKGEKGVALKDNLPTEQYGAYTSLNPSYACVVRYKSRNNIKQKMIGIPILVEAKLKAHPNLKLEYIKNLVNADSIDEIEILMDRIPFNAVLDWDGQICSLVGATDKVEVCNAKEFKIKREKLEKWKFTLHRLLNNKKIKDEYLTEEMYKKHLDEMIEYILEKIEKEYKLYRNLLPVLKQKINDIEIPLELKEKVIKELFNLLKFNSTTANLSDLGLSDRYGRTPGKNISNSKILYASPTGIKSRYYEF